jgi:rhodanese-related sulfurtransferase
MEILQYVLLIVAYALFIFVAMDWMRGRKARKQMIKPVTIEYFQEQAKGGQIIDVRVKEEFKTSHISGSRNFPLKALKRSTAAIRKEQIQFVYGKNYSMAKKGANILQKAGFTRLVVMKGKFEDYTGKLK